MRLRPGRVYINHRTTKSKCSSKPSIDHHHIHPPLLPLPKRLRPGGGPFDQGREIHSRTHKAKKTATIKKTTTIKALNDLRERLLATPIFDGESQEQPENDRSLTGLKSASGTGKNLRVTQVIKSSWNQTMAGVIWSFRLPDYATYGTVKTQPAYLTTSGEARIMGAKERSY